MRIGILGAGRMGGALGRIWANAGHEVCFGFARDMSRLEEVAQSIGRQAHVGSPTEVAAFGDAILLAVPWASVPEALQAAGDLTGKLLIDCTSPLAPDMQNLTLGFTDSGAEEIARQAPGARVVKAFNTLFAEVFQANSRQIDGESPTILMCGDDADAKSVVAQLIGDCGAVALDCGALRMARYEEPFAMLCIKLAFAQGYGPYIGFKFLRDTSSR